jgi:hypothetical protein
MKNAILLCTVLLLSLYYFNMEPTPAMASQVAVTVPATASIRNLNIILNDVSSSNSWLALTEYELLGLLLQDSSRSNITQLAGILINESGANQTPFWSREIMLENRRTDGDIYEEAAALTFNKKSTKQFKALCAIEASRFSKQLLLPRTASYSDVNGAITLALKMSKLSRYRNYSIRLIILSDMLQDTPDGKTLETFGFPANTTIYVVGQASAVDIKQVFPKNNVVELPAFQAAFFTQL